MSSDRVTMDARHNASSTTTSRENAMASILSWTDTPEDLALFPCPPESFTSFIGEFNSRFPDAVRTVRVGGMGKHFDLKTTLLSDGIVRHEMKVTNGKPSTLDELKWRPWKDTVQFLQGQIKSEIVKKFIGDCGDIMITAWFDQVIKPFSLTIPGTEAMTCAGYSKAMSTIGMKGRQEAAAVAFIKALRENTELKDSLHEKWLKFEVEWFTSHTLNRDGLFKVIKEVIEQKDMWICVSKDGINLIEGLKVDGLVYLGAKEKPRGGMSFHYTLTLSKGSETKDIPIECKFHWKNGGQAVQNLNIMIL